MALNKKKIRAIEPGEISALSADGSSVSAPSLSPCGQWIACGIAGNGGQEPLHIVDTRGLPLRQVSTSRGINNSPAWAPDRRTLIFQVLKTSQGRWQLWTGDLHNQRPTQVLLQSTRFRFCDPCFSPCGTYLYYASDQNNHTRTFNLWSLDLRDGEKRQRTFSTDAHYIQPSVASDGTLFCIKAHPATDAKSLVHLKKKGPQEIEIKGKSWSSPVALSRNYLLAQNNGATYLVDLRDQERHKILSDTPTGLSAFFGPSAPPTLAWIHKGTLMSTQLQHFEAPKLWSPAPPTKLPETFLQRIS